MRETLFHLRREILSCAMEGLVRVQARRLASKTTKSDSQATDDWQLPENPTCPEDFRPLEHACFQNPYDFYRMLRDEYPVYQLPNGIFCVSRYEDIVSVSRNTECFSSEHQGLLAGLRQDQDIRKIGARVEKIASLGLVPANVLALNDPPEHSAHRKVGHKGLNARFVKSLEGRVEVLCRSMVDQFIDSGEVEFMKEFAWRLPMVLIIELLGLPARDYDKIKAWCVYGLATQSGIATEAELIESRAEALSFVRYCWRKFLKAKRNPQDNLLGILVNATTTPDPGFNDEQAVSLVIQLLVAGSDSTATSMGNALKMLIENPDIEAELRADMSKLPAYIEEVFRMEAAFQGHFRWVKKETELHGVKLPVGSRIHLMWASGNRDERFWEEPDKIILDRKNGKKHLTFGHGIHACIGRELARMEIRIVLKEFLTRTENLRIDGEAPFVASMLSRTLLKLPIRFDPVESAPNTEVRVREEVVA
ncbi:MAG: cytochrome P450 [Endozoicomonas sp.]